MHKLLKIVGAGLVLVGVGAAVNHFKHGTPVAPTPNPNPSPSPPAPVPPPPPSPPAPTPSGFNPGTLTGSSPGDTNGIVTTAYDEQTGTGDTTVPGVPDTNSSSQGSSDSSSITDDISSALETGDLASLIGGL